MISKARVGLIHSILGIFKLFKLFSAIFAIWITRRFEFLSGFQKNTHYLLLIATGPTPMYTTIFIFKCLIQFWWEIRY